jgi:hypothetical protein
MNEQQAIAQMVSPGMRRPGIFRGGILQILVTRGCDKSCFHCTQGSNLGGKPMMITVDQFAEACDSLQSYFGVVGMFGGNPCIHPQFDKLCRIMREKIPFEQRGLWSNNPLGKGAICAITFNPKVSNLNVHLDQAAHDEFATDWVAAKPYLKGLDSDSRHGPPFVAMQDVGLSEEEIWQNTATCDVNQHWSALIGVFRGELRAWVCELMGAQAMIHQNEPDYPDTGMKVTPGWWRKPMTEFSEQVKYHCRRCGIPLKGYGQLAIGGETEQVSETHKSIYKPKDKDRLVQLITNRGELKEGALAVATNYIENSSVLAGDAI